MMIENIYIKLILGDGMFVNTLDPILFEIGFIQIRWYSLMWLLGFLSVWFVLKKRKNELGVKDADVEQFITYSLLGVVIFARLFHVFVWNPGYYLSNPSQILAIWNGGVSFHGGFVGLLLAGWIWARMHKVSFLHLSDIVVIPATFGLAFGRIGNFFNHELYGPETDVDWCVKFEDVDGCRHPSQLYGAFGRFLLFGFLLFLSRRSRTWKHGFLTLIWMVLIGLGRFLIDFLRVDNRWIGLSTGQWLSALMVVLGVIILWWCYRDDVYSLISIS